MKEAIVWWFQYLRIFALNPPWGVPSKFTIGVTSYEGELIAKMWSMKPKDSVDAYARRRILEL